MKKFYRIIILLAVLIFLTTYNPTKFGTKPKKNDNFFKINNIIILNNRIIDDKKIEENLKTIYGKNIIFVKKSDIDKSLTSVEFLDKFEVKKKYPDTIIVKIYETNPVAIFFVNNSKFIIDSSSNLISYNENMQFGNLPNVFGKVDVKKFINFFNELEIGNFPTKKVKNFYYFQIDRWDLQLLNNKIIKFPSDKLIKAIQQSVELLSRKDFENYNIIDLRIDGKVIVE